MPGRRTVRWTIRAAMTLAALVLAHDLAFMARYGSPYGEALAHAGHGAAWTAAVASGLAIAVALLVGASIQLRRLAVRAGSRTSSDRATPQSLAWLIRAWLGLAVRLAAAVAVLLTIQENVERAGIGIWPPDPGLLASPEYPGALAIVAGVAAAVGLVATLFRWRRDVLLARIRRTAIARPRPAQARRPIEPSISRPNSLLGRRLGLRAPPLRMSIAA